MPAEPSAVEPVEPENDDLSSKTAEPDPDWAPTEDPNATVVPGEMRSDREEIPAPFTKEDADKAETLEARSRMSRAVQSCQYYWPSPHAVCGVIRDKYNSLGGPASFLSFPNSPEYTNPDGYGKRTQFLNGPIYWSAATGAHPVVNSFLNRWGLNNYEAGRLKYPTTDEIVLPDGGRRQEFQQGVIYVAFQNAVGSALLNGPLRDKYNTVGGLTPGSSFLGYPIQDQIAPLPDGQGQMARFKNGVIYWHPAAGAYPVSGLVLQRWADAGYETGSFRYPTGDQTSIDGNATYQQQFQSGLIAVPGPDAIELARLNPGSTADAMITEARKWAEAQAESLAGVLAAALAATRQSLEVAAGGGGSGDPTPGTNQTMPEPRGAGDIFFSRADTGTYDHGHNGIFISKTENIEAVGMGDVTTIVNNANGRQVSSPELSWVNTSGAVRTAAVNWALGKQGRPYNNNFAFNRVVEASTYNCSQLVWAAFMYATNDSIDLDSDGGPGVYPRDLRASSHTTQYYPE